MVDIMIDNVLCSSRYRKYVFTQAVNIVAGASCADGELSMNSRCYRKFHRVMTWYDASNECLSRGGSLAVFNNTGCPSDNRQLTDWLNTSGTNKTYWTGLIRSTWQTKDKGDVCSCSHINSNLPYVT